MPHLRQLVARFSLWKPAFNTRLFHMGFVVSKGAHTTLSTAVLTRKIWGMTKKRRTFLKSAPNRRPNALRLLSAPSVRFWQQTAICPISLWELVVELHPLNWARVQAVRRINDKVTMKELEDQLVCEMLLQTWEKFYRDFQLLNPAYGEDCMKGSPRLKKERMIRLKINVVLVCFNWKCIVHH
jgi:hypothetical protein